MVINLLDFRLSYDDTAHVIPHFRDKYAYGPVCRDKPTRLQFNANTVLFNKTSTAFVTVFAERVHKIEPTTVSPVSRIWDDTLTI